MQCKDVVYVMYNYIYIIIHYISQIQLNKYMNYWHVKLRYLQFILYFTISYVTYLTYILAGI
jgi:hypothetical protein